MALATRKPELTVEPAVVRRGTLGAAHLQASYYTAQPAPTQWVAVAVVSGPAAASPRLLVGRGRTELQALDSLRSRLESAAR